MKVLPSKRPKKYLMKDLKKCLNKGSKKYLIKDLEKCLDKGSKKDKDLKNILINDVDIVYVKGSAYRNHFWYMSKDDAISIMNKSNLNDKMDVL